MSNTKHANNFRRSSFASKSNIMKNVLLLFLLFGCTTLFGQQTIDKAIPFQNDNQKKYSIYVPSGYDANQPAKLMVGLHPFNTNRWDAQSWRDTLITFSEENNLLMLCPDGGSDGRIDDQIDTAFTTFLIDSMLQWYNVDESKIFLMGFSWGGRTTYSYGLNHADRFAGFMPIGAAMSGITGNEAYFSNANKKAFFVIHGSADSPQSRYFPFINSLDNNGACHETNYLQGINHTIDFPNRNQILTDAFQWLDGQNCASSSVKKNDVLSSKISVFPNPISINSELQINSDLTILKVELFDLSGKKLTERSNSNQLKLNPVLSGFHTLKIHTSEGIAVKKIEVLK